MNGSRILPFYMAYPLPLYYQEEDTVTRDLEYLQQMYPSEAKRYQKVIADILNQIDYEGSVIYDEYPDKWQLYRLSKIVMDKLKRDGTIKGETPESEAASSDHAERNCEQVEEFVQVLLYYEIYKKRHANHNGILKF